MGLVVDTGMMSEEAMEALAEATVVGTEDMVMASEEASEEDTEEATEEATDTVVMEDMEEDGEKNNCGSDRKHQRVTRIGADTFMNE